MNATEIMYIKAGLQGKTLESTWGSPWSGFTAEEVRKFEDDCESKFNTQKEVDACVAEKKRAGKVNLGGIFNTGLGILQNYQDQKGTGTQSSTYTPEPETTKSNTWLWVTLGVIAVGGVIGIAYYMNKNKGK